MGIQVTVELKDIPADWNPRVEVESIDIGCGSECPIGPGHETCVNILEVEYLLIDIPNVGTVQSPFPDMLVFDNKFANMEIREELDRAQIPYVRA